MKRPTRSDQEQFRRELEIYSSTITELAKRRQETSFMEKQTIFWTESARFLITELEIWDKMREDTRYDATVVKIQKIFQRLNGLINQLTEENYGGIDSSEEDE